MEEWIKLGIAILIPIASFIFGYGKLVEKMENHSQNDDRRFMELGEMIHEKHGILLKHDGEHYEKIGRLETQSAAQLEINKSRDLQYGEIKAELSDIKGILLKLISK